MFVSQADYNSTIHSLNLMGNAVKQLQASPTVATKETTVPTFSGKEDDRTAEAWWAKLLEIQAENRWTNDKLQAKAVSALTKKAEDWYRNRKFEFDSQRCDDFASLANFKASFFGNFAKIRTLSDKITCTYNLRQEKKEDVRDFHTRVSILCQTQLREYQTEEKWTPVQGSEDFIRQQAVMDYDERTNRRNLFVNGLLPPLRDAVLPRLEQELGSGSKKPILQLAVELETAQRAMTTTPSRQSNSGGGNVVQTDAVERLLSLDLTGMPKALKESILVAQTDARGRGRGRGRGRDRDRGGRGRGGGGRREDDRGAGGSDDNIRDKIQRRTKAAFCKVCKQWGKHYANECNMPRSQIAVLEEADPNERPAKGDLFDMCYDEEEAEN
jgi:hypothetical protein